MSLSAKRRTFLGGAAGLIAAGALEYPKSKGPGGRRAKAQDDSLSIAMLEVHAERLEPLIDAYAEQTDIDCAITPLAYGELYSQLSIALTQRSPDFDVVSLDDSWVPQFASFLQPFERLSATSSIVVPIAQELARYPSDATPCGVPWLGNAQFMVMRSDWLERFDQPEPSTWDETIEAASAITAALEPNEELAAFGISTLTPHALIDSFLPVLRGFGKDLIDPETSIPQLDTPEALGAVAVFQQLAAMSPVESAATGEPTNIDRFGSGELAMMSNFWSSDLLQATGGEGGRIAGPIGCAQQPAQASIDRRSMPGVWIAAIPVGSERTDRAREFVEWLVSLESQLAMVDALLPPIAAPAYVDDALIDRQPHLPQLLDLLAGATPRARSPYYPQLELLLATELERMLDGELTGEDAMRAANLAMREFLSREGVLVS